MVSDRSEDLGGHLSTYTPSSNPKEDIKEPLERIMPHLIYKLVGPDSYSWHASLMLMFNHIDFLGHLSSGGSVPKNQAKCAVKFIREYLGRIDPRYKEVGGLLYFTLRHGLTHKSFAKRIRLENGDILGYVLSDTKKRPNHLSVARAGSELRIKFSVSLFYEDLLAAVDVFCDDIGKNRQSKNAYDKAWVSLAEPEPETLKCEYIEVSDWDFVKKISP